jgi:hypothetical protein
MHSRGFTRPQLVRPTATAYVQPRVRPAAAWTADCGHLCTAAGSPGRSLDGRLRSPMYSRGFARPQLMRPTVTAYAQPRVRPAAACTADCDRLCTAAGSPGRSLYGRARFAYVRPRVRPAAICTTDCDRLCTAAGSPGRGLAQPQLVWTVRGLHGRLRSPMSGRGIARPQLVRPTAVAYVRPRDRPAAACTAGCGPPMSGRGIARPQLVGRLRPAYDQPRVRLAAACMPDCDSSTASHGFARLRLV